MSDAKRERALPLLEEGKSAVEAARELDVSASTVRTWRHRAGRSGPPKGEDVESWAERKERSARASYAVALQALAEVRRLLAAGKPGDAQRAALTMAITLDKSAMLEEQAARAQEREAKLTQAYAEQLAEIIRKGCPHSCRREGSTELGVRSAPVAGRER